MFRVRVLCVLVCVREWQRALWFAGTESAVRLVSPLQCYRRVQHMLYVKKRRRVHSTKRSVYKVLPWAYAGVFVGACVFTARIAAFFFW